MDQNERDLDESLVREAFEEALDILGERMKRSIIFDLECTGNYRHDGECTPENIAHGLRRLFGSDAAEIILEKMFLRLDEPAIMEKS